ncbi:MAG: TetR/AcrR family transcriptional regulator [Phaeodactylibacter sp.]|nr:TetR/AcrR family transcriptional regulator [Phaeodactylibacter sp.]
MSPRTKKQFEEIRQRSMEAIKKAAMELFAHNGYHSTSISQIAKEAGISKGLLYNYFDSKEDLLHDIIMEAVDMGEQIMGDVLSSPEEAAQQLRSMTEVTFEVVRKDLHYWKLMTSLAFQTDVLTNLMPELRKKQGEAVAAIADIFRRLGSGEPEKEALYYGAVLDGIMLHYMQMEETYPIEEMKAYVLSRFLPERYTEWQ